MFGSKETKTRVLKKGIDGSDSRRRREDTSVLLRKSKREEQILKRRQTTSNAATAAPDENKPVNLNVQSVLQFPANGTLEEKVAAIPHLVGA
jgi:hypothetical protein